MDITYITGVMLPLAYTFLSAAAITVARATGMIILTPAFARLGLTGLVRSAAAVVISLPLMPLVFQTAMNEVQASGELLLVLILFKELAIGCMIGLVFGVPFWAAEAAGNLVDLQRGATLDQLVDPASTTESTIVATLLSVTMVALFFMSGGFLLLLDGFYRSYEIWPPASIAPVLRDGTFPIILGLLDRILVTALVMIAPIVVALLLAETMLAFLSRMSPQLHIFDLSLAVKNLLFCVMILLYAQFLLPVLLDLLGTLGDTVAVLRGIAGS